MTIKDGGLMVGEHAAASFISCEYAVFCLSLVYAHFYAQNMMDQFLLVLENVHTFRPIPQQVYCQIP